MSRDRKREGVCTSHVGPVNALRMPPMSSTHHGDVLIDGGCKQGGLLQEGDMGGVIEQQNDTPCTMSHAAG